LSSLLVFLYLCCHRRWLRKMSRRAVVTILTAITAIVLVAATLSYVGFQEFYGRLVSVSPFPVAASFLCTFLFFVLRAARWRILLSEVGGTGFLATLGATGLGYLVNTLVPVRFGGEVARAAAVSQRRGVTFTAAAGTIVVERVLDVLYLVGITSALLLVVPSSFELPQLFVYSAWAAAGLGIGGLIFLIVAAKMREPTVSFVGKVIDATRLPQEWRRALKNALTSLVDGVASVRRFYGDAKVNALSFSIWLTQGAIFSLLLAAAGSDIPLLLSFTGSLLVTVSFVLPGATGYVDRVIWVWAPLLAALGMASNQAYEIGLVVHLLSIAFVLILAATFSSLLGFRVAQVFQGRLADKASRE